MEMALSAKNKLQFVDGSLPRLATTDAQWTRHNDVVASWILNSVSKQLAKSVLYIDSVVGIWKDLNERFFQGNGPQIFQIQKSIVSLSQGQDRTLLVLISQISKDYGRNCRIISRT